MRNRFLLLTLSTALLIGGLLAPAGAGPKGGGKPPQSSAGHLEMYEATVPVALVDQITSAGYDVVDIQLLADEQALITLVLYPSDVRALRKMGVDIQLWHNDDGLTSTELALQQTSAGFKVWRDNDGPDGLEQYARDFADAHPAIVKLEKIGESHGNPGGDPRDILALQVTQGADGPDGGFAGDQKP
ncbi:MAG: hypothetical protein ACRDH9_06810, partial [Actinomycetota bacterium]